MLSITQSQPAGSVFCLFHSELLLSIFLFIVPLILQISRPQTGLSGRLRRRTDGGTGAFGCLRVHEWMAGGIPLQGHIKQLTPNEQASVCHGPKPSGLWFGGAPMLRVMLTLNKSGRRVYWGGRKTCRRPAAEGRGSRCQHPGVRSSAHSPPSLWGSGLCPRRPQPARPRWPCGGCSHLLLGWENLKSALTTHEGVFSFCV